VDLDLNGFMLTGAGNRHLGCGGVDHVAVRNGVLVGGTVGIDFPGGPGSRKIDVEDVKIRDTSAQGIHLGDVQGAALRRNEITDTGSEGIAWDGPGTVKHGTIENNLLRRTSAGIVVNNCSSVAILNNRLEEPGTGAGGAFPGDGIVLLSCQASLVSENTIERSRVEGIFLLNAKGNKLFDNVSVQPDSGRAALQTFTGGKGDALISYENEAIFAQQTGRPERSARQGTQNLIERND
jgi:parallel beta-helix repeat protein